MKRWFRLARLAIPALALLVCAPSARAEGPIRAQGPIRVQDEIARTDMRIERADLLLGRAPSPDAQRLLDDARLIQSRAKSAFAAPRPGMALRLTLQARGVADRAISMAQGLPDPDRVWAQLERTREIIERARDRIADCMFDRARALLQVAAAMEQRAEDAAHEERHLAALQLTMSARERALRSLRLCNRADGPREMTERALRRTDEILARVQDVVGESGDELAHQALERAAGMQAQARQEFLADRFEPCLRLTQSARSNAQRAIRLAGGSI